MHGGTSTRQTAAGVGDQAAPFRDDTQQGGLRRPFPATHAGAHRARLASRWGVYRVRRIYDGSAGASVSLWMSMRHPVSRAASRAFWPSLPIARLSW